MAINNEAAKENRDEAKLQQLNSELRETYAKVMQNKNMNAYNEAKRADGQYVKTYQCNHQYFRRRRRP